MRFALVLAALAALALPAAASADAIGTAAAALQSSPVYVAPGARSELSAADAAKVRQAISGSAEPIYVAVLPASAANAAGGSPDTVVRTLARDLGRSGTYAVVVGNHFRAGSTDMHVSKLADEAFSAHHSEGVAATLLDFVRRVRTQAAGGGGGGGGGSASSGGWIVAVIVGAIVLFFVVRRVSRRHRESEELAEVREAARGDLVALAEDVSRLEHAVEGNRAAEDEYRHALESYERASRAFDRARSPEDMRKVAHELELGRYAMTAAAARVEGREPPPRRPPCFFDPRHGPSSRDVEWAPPGGTPRPVPACEADAQRVERGEDPESRQVLVGGRAVPYWAAPSYFGPFSGGFFGGFGGFLPGLFLGEMLGGGFGWGGPGWYGGYGGYDDYGGDPGNLGGGDFGGGDFSGGDFGGGDFGGGDFGGGGDF